MNELYFANEDNEEKKEFNKFYKQVKQNVCSTNVNENNINFCENIL